MLQRISSTPTSSQDTTPDPTEHNGIPQCELGRPSFTTTAREGLRNKQRSSSEPCPCQSCSRLRISTSSSGRCIAAVAICTAERKVQRGVGRKSARQFNYRRSNTAVQLCDVAGRHPHPGAGRNLEEEGVHAKNWVLEEKLESPKLESRKCSQLGPSNLGRHRRNAQCFLLSRSYQWEPYRNTGK